MSRRFFSLFSVIGTLLVMSSVVELLSPQQLPTVASIYFVVMAVLQVVPLLATKRGRYGHRRHPVNRMYTVLSVVGLVGTALLAVVVYLYSPIWLVTVAGALMIMGIVGAGVLAFFATPWNDWSTRSGIEGEDDPYEYGDQPVEDVWDKNFSA